LLTVAAEASVSVERALWDRTIEPAHRANKVAAVSGSRALVFMAYLRSDVVAWCGSKVEHLTSSVKCGIKQFRFNSAFVQVGTGLGGRFNWEAGGVPTANPCFE
jgi:hypothetical protein